MWKIIQNFVEKHHANEAVALHVFETNFIRKPWDHCITKN